MHSPLRRFPSECKETVASSLWVAAIMGVSHIPSIEESLWEQVGMQTTARGQRGERNKNAATEAQMMQ